MPGYMVVQKLEANQADGRPEAGSRETDQACLALIDQGYYHH